MPNDRHRVAILFPGITREQQTTKVEQTRFASITEALVDAGADVVGVPYADERIEEARAQLVRAEGILVWFNPIEGGRNRSLLNALLREVAGKGLFISAHPDVIDKMGTKEVLYRTRTMSWGCDTRFHPTLETMREKLPASLALGARVLKQIRGQSGEGVWRVELADSVGSPTSAGASDIRMRVRHAKRGCVEQTVSLDGFVAMCRPYFAAGGSMIDQPYQPRLPEGMVRCYVVGDQVAGFGEQLVNALYPPAPGQSATAAPQPGPRLYFPPDRPDLQPLRAKLENEWIPELCREVGLERRALPVLWDADFLYGPKDSRGVDTYVLCEINVSSVYPFPPAALAPLVMETLARLKGNC
jgi:hypothetical protein